MTRYSSGEALKYSSTYSRALSTSFVAACDEGLLECGFPKTPAARILRCASIWDSA
jgi:hypothetical protein